MAPPTAGTFIYHTHYHDENQLTNGIIGPIIVMPSGAKFDPETDKTFLFALGPQNPFGPVVLHVLNSLGFVVSNESISAVVANGIGLAKGSTPIGPHILYEFASTYPTKFGFIISTAAST